MLLVCRVVVVIFMVTLVGDAKDGAAARVDACCCVDSSGYGGSQSWEEDPLSLDTAEATYGTLQQDPVHLLNS